MAIKSIKDIVKRIKALREKTVDRGATEAEAMAAAKMVGDLMDKHQLQVSDIDVRESEVIRKGVDLEGKMLSPLAFAAQGIARYCDCETWRDLDRNKNNVVFFGLPHDVEMAEFILAVVLEAAKTEFAKFKESPEYMAERIALSTDARIMKNSFNMGLSDRVNKRLDQMKRERMADAEHSKALVPLKNQVITEAMASEGIKLRHSNAKGQISPGSYRAGDAAGRRVPLRKGVGGVGNAPKLTTTGP